MNKNYPVFVHWINVTDWILERCEKLPKSVRFTLATRISNNALDILEGIIDAIYTKERRHILEKVNLSLEKLRVFFRICFQRKYISSSQYEYISEQLDQTGKMIGGWRKISL